MAPPPSMECSVPECAFKTPEGIPTYDQVLQCLTLHTNANHPHPAAAAANPKPDKLKRPTISDGVTEADCTIVRVL